MAKDFMQREGIDYNEIFSPVSYKDSFRIIMILVAYYDLELCKDDISQRKLGENCLRGTTERFCYGRKRTNGMPSKEIYSWIKTSFKTLVLEV